MIEKMTETNNNVLKRKKLNIFQRFSQRISKYFHRSKPLKERSQEDVNLEISCLDDDRTESKSQDDLGMKTKFQKKRKPRAKRLNMSVFFAPFKRRKETVNCIAKKNDRWLSEGDISREDSKFYSKEPSPKITASQNHDSEVSHILVDETNNASLFNDSAKKSFKNELALKLRSKNPSRDNVSDHSKTPDSPRGIRAGATPPRQPFTEARTPQSMSSLSHSSNSLLSGNVANNYGTSDGESMSRSMIDSNDDSGIVVDLATPISKTTNAALLDFSAARQKIAANKARRVRPKAQAKDGADQVLQVDSERFSPVRDKRDILEEIREEDCLTPHTSTGKDNKLIVNPSFTRVSPTPKLLIQDNVPLTHKIVSIKLDSSSNDPPHSQQSETVYASQGDKNTDNDSFKTSFNLRKSKFQFNNDSPITENVEPTPKFYVKLRSTASSVDRYKDRKTESVVITGHTSKSLLSKEDECAPGPPKINRYSSLRTVSDTPPSLAPHFSIIRPSIVRQDSSTPSNVTGDYDDKRASRVLTMVKNFETVPSRDSH